MNHLPSSSTYKMHSHASFGLGLTFLITISSTDLSAESIHNKTFNGVLPRWLMHLIYPSSYTKIQISKQINQYELQNQSFYRNKSNNICLNHHTHITYYLSTELHTTKRQMPYCEIQTCDKIIETVSVGLQTYQNCHASKILMILY